MKALIHTFLVFFSLSATLIVFSPKASAYEIDTHCYDNYTMARTAGFTHEYALFFCATAQWVDEGVSSTPMGDLILGSMLRRIWHFPNYRFQPREVTQDGHGSFRAITIADFDHPVAYKLFDEGLKEGNWFKIALAFHIVQDTAGHAGWTAELGHAEGSHDPDRTWEEPAKYKMMTGLIFKMLLALRIVAPDEALEPWAKEARKNGIRPGEYKELENKNWLNMEKTISLNILKDPRFTPNAVAYILRIARAKGYLVKSFDVDANLPTEADYLLSPAEQQEARLKYTIKYEDSTPDYVDPFNLTRRDARQVLRNWVIKKRQEELARGILVTGSIFNLEILDYFGQQGLREELLRIETLTTDIKIRMAAHDRLINKEFQERLVGKMVNYLADGEVPKERDAFTNVKVETDDGARSLEVEIKVADRRERIYQLFGVNFLFQPNTLVNSLKQKAQKKKEDAVQALDPSVNLKLHYNGLAIPDNVEVEVVTLNKYQQWGVFFVKNGHNARTLGRDILDNKFMFKGKIGIAAHKRVREFQIGDLLHRKVLNGEYKFLGPLSDMSFYGVSKAPECAITLTNDNDTEVIQ